MVRVVVLAVLGVGLASGARADDHADGSAGATVVRVGAAVAGRIDAAGDRDVFRLAARTGERFVVEVDRLSGGMDSLLDLYAPDGRHLVRDDDGGDGVGSRIAFAAQVDGDHFLTVVHYDAAARTGGYRLTVSGSSAATGSSGGSVASGSSATGGPEASAAPGAGAATGDLTLGARVFDPKLRGASLAVRTRRSGSGTYAARLVVLDGQGRIVRVVAEGSRRRGQAYDDVWDGRGPAGRFVTPGPYTVRLEGGGDAASARVDVVRLGIRAVAFEGAGRVPLAYHRAERWAGSLFPIDNAGPAWTLPASTLGEGCLDDAAGSALPTPAPWADVDGPPRTRGGSLLARGRSLPVAYVAGAAPRVVVTLGDAAHREGGGTVGCGYPLAGRRLRVVVEGGPSADQLSGELLPGGRTTLDLPAVPRSLGKHTLRLVFRFMAEEPDGSWRAVPGLQETEHTLYTVLARPDRAELPGGLPWVAALDLVAPWLAGSATTAEAVQARLTEGLNARLGLRYDVNLGAPAYTGGDRLDAPELDLSAFLDDRAYGSTVNCLDCASLVTKLAAQLGAPGAVQILGWDFRLFTIRAIGGPYMGWQLPAFSYHATGTFDGGGSIHDPCLTLDDDARPWSAPYLERLPVGMPLSRYTQQLSPDVVRSRAIGRARVR